MARDDADGKTIRDLTGLDATADRQRFLVAYPDGLDGRWNGNWLLSGLQLPSQPGLSALSRHPGHHPREG
jgi:hypothetical protein